MKNTIGFLITSESNSNSFETLNTNELLNIRGGVEPIRPISRPKDEYDDEKQQ